MLKIIRQVFTLYTLHLFAEYNKEIDNITDVLIHPQTFKDYETFKNILKYIKTTILKIIDPPRKEFTSFEDSKITKNDHKSSPDIFIEFLKTTNSIDKLDMLLADMALKEINAEIYYKYIIPIINQFPKFKETVTHLYKQDNNSIYHLEVLSYIDDVITIKDWILRGLNKGYIEYSIENYTIIDSFWCNIEITLEDLEQLLSILKCNLSSKEFVINLSNTTITKILSLETIQQLRELLDKYKNEIGDNQYNQWIYQIEQNKVTARK